ncbi:hypothetical protein [Candidatus Thiosymbion oneisti]|nr:hypothetical protein [Candidatus Thiosymbion oneisti]
MALSIPKDSAPVFTVITTGIGNDFLSCPAHGNPDPDGVGFAEDKGP